MLQMVLSSLFFAVMAAFARLAGERLPAQEVVLARSIVATLITLPLMGGVRLLGRRPALLAVRGVTGFLGLSCYFFTVIHLPFAEAVLLAQINPIFTALLSWLFLGERPGARFAPAALLVFSGVLLVVPPDLSNLESNAWAAVGLLGAFFAASAYTEVRALSRTEHPLTIVLWFQLVSVVLAVPGTVVSGFVRPQGIDWLWILGVGVTGQLGQIFLTKGLSRVPAGRGTLANPLVVSFGALIGWAAFGEALDWGDLAGGVLLVCGLLLAGLVPARAVTGVPAETAAEPRPGRTVGPGDRG